jgi:CheY-like chemotaxis protein
MDDMAVGWRAFTRLVCQMQVNTVFQKHIRSALNHLYDHEYLRQCPLAAELGLSKRFDVPIALRKILKDAIEALKPSAREPVGSTPRQIYDVLLYRYVQQFEQEEVAHQLGVSERHMRRIQSEALDALACHLWDQYNLDDRQIVDAPSIESHALEKSDTAADAADDFNWLKGTQSERVADAQVALTSIVELARPLAAQHHVRLEFGCQEQLPDLAIHPVALRQIMLNLLSVAIYRADEGAVTLNTHIRLPFIDVKIENTTSPANSATDTKAQERNLLETASRLAEFCSSEFSLSDDSAPFSATLSVPIVDSVRVLVIDDTDDIIHLLERYAVGTRYSVIGTNQPEQAVTLVQEYGIQLIVLDVMMPKLDGWEMLGRLRQHPLTAHIPIIILTILDQEELALSLNAQAHLMKPVTQEAFLAVLDQVSAALAPEYPPHS